MPIRRNTDAGIYPYATQSGKRWGAVYYVDRDWASGRPRQKRKQGFLTKAEAQEWRVRQLAERNKTGRVQEPSRQPLGAYLEDWLAGMTGIAPTTLMNYTNRLARAKHALGMIPLASLTPVIIERHTADRIRNGDKPSEVRYSFRLLKRALRRAVHLGLIPANPCEPLKPPRVDPRTPTTWTLDEMRRFLESTADDPEWGTVWALLAQTWIRIGELMDLRWGDIDFAERTVTITHAMSRDANYQWHSGKTKTPGSKRTIPISDTLTRRLRALQMASGSRDAAGFVFTSATTGDHLTTHAIGRTLRHACLAAGVPVLTTHEIRHTGGSLAHMAGEDIMVISERLGHSSISITMTVYLHSNAGHHRAAGDRIGALFEMAHTHGLEPLSVDPPRRLERPC